MSRARRATRAAGVWIVLALEGAVAVAPFILATLVAAMSREQFASDGAPLPDPWTAENFIAVLTKPYPLLAPAALTAAIAAVLCLVQTVSSIFAAYAFARFEFAGRRILFALMMLLWLMPPIVTVLPLYLAFATMRMAGTFVALVLPFVLASPYAVFLLRQWFAGIPADLFDAAAIDGASAWTAFRRIAMPLSAPAVASVVLVTAVTVWNSYLWPRLIAGTRLPQIQVSIASLQTQYDANWTLVLAASSLALLPPLVITVLLQRPFLRIVQTQPKE